ncbi:MAG TPA: SDR family NAD(P)-dependent oxidoreductase [Acidimicrobiales bacterium]|nr:SDR family NAD(P)-dependent oxidoreductase [Acidimicrobiales bacterium]
MEIRGRRALVTGASKGIGAAIARELARAGAHVVLVARDAQAIAMLADELGGSAYAADLADLAQVSTLLSRVTAGGSPVDILVNNAGIETAGHIVALIPDDIAAVFALNIVAPAVLCGAFAKPMMERGEGHIVNISSLAGVAAFPGLAAYSASKAALTHFTAGLRADFRGTAVGTTLVELGPVRTDMYSRAMSYGPTSQAFRRMLALGMIAEIGPELVARKVVEAVRLDRRHVRLPRRAGLSSVMQEMPRRLAEYMLAGVEAGPGSRVI